MSSDWPLFIKISSRQCPRLRFSNPKPAAKGFENLKGRVFSRPFNWTPVMRLVPASSRSKTTGLAALSLGCRWVLIDNNAQ